MIYNSVLELIGKTPLVRIDEQIVVKLEMFNPGGSAKDRIGLSIIEDAINSGRLKPGDTVIEETSGNTGIGLALVCAVKGINLIVVMPDNMSIERVKLIKAYGAKIVLTPGKLGMQGAVDKALELHKEIPNSIIAGQFDNSANPMAHYRTTGPEIYRETDGKVDIFVAGIGTGGTISGTAKYLKEKNKNIKIVGVNPTEFPHKLQGIGAGFTPKNLNESIIDENIGVTTEQAYSSAQELSKKYGIFVGITSGAAFFAAKEMKKKYPGKQIVALLTDTGSRYISTEGFIE